MKDREIAQPHVMKVTAGTAVVELPSRTITVGPTQAIALDGKADIWKFDKREADSLDEFGKVRAAILVRASDLYRQELQQSQSVDAAAAQAAAAPPATYNPESRRYVDPAKAGPSPIPGGTRRTTSVGYGICGGW